MRVGAEAELTPVGGHAEAILVVACRSSECVARQSLRAGVIRRFLVRFEGGAPTWSGTHSQIPRSQCLWMEGRSPGREGERPLEQIRDQTPFSSSPPKRVMKGPLVCWSAGTCGRP